MATTTLTPFVDFLKTFGVAEPDAELLSRFARSGDEAAFAELVRRHGPAVLGVCRRVVRDDHAAEDAFQAAFLLLATKASALRHPELLANWLHGVAYRTALKLRSRLWRRRLREHPLDENSLAPATPDPDICPDLDAAIQRLPSKYRVPVVLCYLQGLTNAEAAQRVGCPANTIATRLARARHRLRTQLARQGLTVAASSALIAATARNASALGNSLPLSPNILTLMEGVRRAMFWNKVKIAVAALALVTIGGVGVSRLSYRAGAGEPPGTGTPVAGRPIAPVGPPIAPDTRPATPIHIPPIDLSKRVEESKNFVVAGADAETCRKIALAAEKYRKELAKFWLRKELPDWHKPCPITLKTGPGLGNSSATVFQFDKEFTIVGVTLEGPIDQILNNLLPHEIVHTILADHFRKRVPRWADEGAASLAEDATEFQRYDAAIRRGLRDGKALHLCHLFSLKDYPADFMTFYAQSVSVVAYLTTSLEGHNRTTFVKFVEIGMDRGWETAVKEIYNFETTDDMEHAWIAWLRKTKPKAPSADPLVQYAGSSPLPPQLDLPPPMISPPPPGANSYRPQPPTANDPPPSQSVDIPPVQAGSAAAPATPPPQEPLLSPPALTVVMASMDKDGKIACKFPKVVVYAPVTSYVPDQSGKYREATAYVRRTTQEERIFETGQLRICGTNGKEIDSKELAKKLQKETPVILVTGAPIDSELLPMLKEGTLIVSVKGSLPTPSTTSPNMPKMPLR